MELAMLLRCSLVVLVACTSGREGDKPGAPVRAAVPDVAARRAIELEEPPVALPRELAFELLHAGRGDDRAPLRYAMPSARTGLTVATTLTSRELKDGTWGEPTPHAATETLVAATPFTFDDRGRLTAPADRSASVDDDLQRLLALTVPLPAEPIGEGASWRVITALRQGGVALRQTATYTLEARRVPWRITVDIQRLAEPQRVSGVELVAIVRRLRGTFEIDPRQVLPARGALDVESTVHVRSGAAETIVEDRGSIALEPFVQVPLKQNLAEVAGKM